MADEKEPPKKEAPTTESKATENDNDDDDKSLTIKGKTAKSTSSSSTTGKSNSKSKSKSKETTTSLTVRKHDDNKDSDELTKRLQKLALERQKESKGDRLKVIQGKHDNHLQHLSGAKTFDELDLPQELLDAVYAMGFDRPSAIQEEALPRILAGRNLIGQAQSGSGKTAAFTLGMLRAIVVDTPATTQAVCVTPTRELAIQIVDKAVAPMAANLQGLQITLAIAGAELNNNNNTNSANSSRTIVDAHLVVGTPGKMVDWLKRKYLKVNRVKVFVLDEADTMVEEGGHRANSLLIKKQMPKSCQTLLFSATFPEQVVKFATRLVDNPDKILIEDGPEFLMLDIIKQLWIDCREYPGGKIEFLADIYSLLTIGQSIVFVRTVHQADQVHHTLQQAGYTCSVLHGRVEPAARDATMDAFRSAESNVLITTNVLARGVDVDNVCLVINYDVPTSDKNGTVPDYETYLHRIGRTGRFGRKGTAINLIDNPQDLQILAAIEQHYSKNGQEMIQKAEADPEQLADVIEI